MPKRQATVVDANKQDDFQKIDENIPEDSTPQMALKNMRELILLGRLSESVSISGFNFELSTLSAGEQKNIMKTIMKTDEADRILSAKAIAISYSLRSINSIPLSEASAESDGESERDKKVNFVLQMQSSLVDRLFTVYESLVKRSGEEVGLSDLKK